MIHRPMQTSRSRHPSPSAVLGEGTMTPRVIASAIDWMPTSSD